MSDNGPSAACFTENTKREPGERPIYSVTVGEHWNSVFIQVSLETYLSKHFDEWVKNFVATRIKPGGDLRIAITYPKKPENN